MPTTITGGGWCPRCSDHCPIQSHERFVEIVRTKGGTILGEYVNVATKVRIRCSNHHEWNVRPNDIQSGYWCLICNLSKGEEAIRNFLKYNNIYHVEQYQLKELSKKKYDFYVYYNNVHYLIEYNVHFHRTEEEYKYRQNCDRLKNYMVILLGYKIVRIDYTQLKYNNDHLQYALSRDEHYYTNYNMYSYLNREITLDIREHVVMENNGN